MDQTLPLPHTAAEVTHSTLPFPAKKKPISGAKHPQALPYSLFTGIAIFATMSPSIQPHYTHVSSSERSQIFGIMPSRDRGRQSQPMEQRAQKPDLFGLCRVVTEEDKVTEEDEVKRR